MLTVNHKKHHPREEAKFCQTYLTLWNDGVLSMAMY